ncbi:glycosyltransferase family A protein [uncultured Pontibacter sp.]|uniref:glycosyltransferase n=1 Tax=uncultured Pontibacter sp. TaxID=453356 RepID=UPI00260AC6F2|nr:glycosyltransferase family A protein [uncultured Pontibacter sp.]
MGQPFVSIIIPTYNDWGRLSICLEALEKQSYPSAFLEIIVVNNNPSDTQPCKYKLPHNCTLIDEAKPGSYAARNAALQLAKGEVIGFTDSDCVPDKDWIRNAVTFLEKHKEVQRVGGAVEIFFSTSKPSKVELYDKLFAFPQEAYVKAGNAVTANMFTYKYVFDEIGMFNASLMSGGDYQWGMLAHKNGYKIGYAPDAIVKHPARPSIKELVIKAKRVGKGQAKFKTSKRKSIYKQAISIAKLIKPRTWEIKSIFQQGKSMSISNKLFLVFLRHYIIWVGGFARLKSESSSSS